MLRQKWNLKKNRLLAVLLGLAVILFCLGAGSFAGSSDDPLVTKGWVDKYLDNRVAELDKRLDGIATDLGANAKSLEMWINKKTIRLNGKQSTMDVAPILKDGRTMLPIKYLADFFGAKGSWDGAAKKVTYTKGSLKLELLVGKKEYRVNGVSAMGDVAPIIKDGRTLVPMRLVSDSFAAKVTWDSVAKKVTIRY